MSNCNGRTRFSVHIRLSPRTRYRALVPVRIPVSVLVSVRITALNSEMVDCFPKDLDHRIAQPSPHDFTSAQEEFGANQIFSDGSGGS